MSRASYILLLALFASLACSSDDPTLVTVEPDIDVSPRAIDFGAVDVGARPTMDLEIGNRGTGTIAIDPLVIEGAQASAFSVSPRELVKLAAGRSKIFTVAFTPDLNGVFSAVLRVAHDVPRVDPIDVSLVGTGRACVDNDHDTYGDGCGAGADCDDTRDDTHPNADEMCDGIDNDCDDDTDEGATPRLYHRDADGDQHGTSDGLAVSACAPPDGYVATDDDCDDANEGVHPGAQEICTGGIDEDCNQLVDANDPSCHACRTQDDCGLNENHETCPLAAVSSAPMCMPLCRRTSDCATGDACRPLPGSTSLGFCAAAGAAAAGANCASMADCRSGVCNRGHCRELCQAQSDCTGSDECSFVLYDTSEIGGPSARRLATVCRPTEGRAALGGSCIVQSGATSDACNTTHCDMAPYVAGLSGSAPCAPLCSSSADCTASQVCGLVYNGLAETPMLASTQEASGRYFEAIRGCYTPIFQSAPDYWEPLPPGTGALGSTCDATSPTGRLVCRSHLCAGFDPIRNRCTDFCDADNDCDSPSTRDWKCQVGEVTLSGTFLQSFGIADNTKFALAGICAP